VSYRAESLLWLLQRASAAVLALCVVVHGLTGEEVLARTRGSVAWFAFYSLFVLAVTVHVPIGLRAVCIEWLGWRRRSRDFFLIGFSGLLAWSGMSAVIAVFA
jgi:fumarate reductase subunit C